jgi:hypothetical protein
VNPIEEQLMDTYAPTPFLHLADAHATAVAKLRTLRHIAGRGGQEVRAELGDAQAEEGNLRAAIIGFKPGSAIEAQTKFLYMVHFIASARISLDAQEMATMMDSIAHLR